MIKTFFQKNTCGFVLIALLLLPAIASAQEFDVFKSSPIRNRHLTSPLMSFGTSMALYAAGVKAEVAAPIGFATTALTEHFMHKGRHGITFSEYKMIAVGTVGQELHRVGLHVHQRSLFPGQSVQLSLGLGRLLEGLVVLLAEMGVLGSR